MELRGRLGRLLSSLHSIKVADVFNPIESNLNQIPNPDRQYGMRRDSIDSVQD